MSSEPEPKQTPKEQPDSDKATDEADRATNTSPRARQIFALVVGIDKYQHNGPIIRNLSGCKNDVEDIVDFLRQSLDVPASNITQLRDEAATAAAITEALQNLAKDKRIIKGDAIVIFYAGHGTEVLPPRYSNSDDQKIQVLAPYDFHFIVRKMKTSALKPSAEGERCTDIEFGEVENGLMDTKLNELLKNIADEKGDNITVILDCCHSGSGTRDFGNTMSPRSIDLPKDTRLSSDAFPASRGSFTPDDEKNKGLASHTLLAAAASSQHAYESDTGTGQFRGVFTSSLTKVLRTRSQDLKRMTNEDIISDLKLDRQNPQCEGINKNRIFLRDHPASPRPTPVKLSTVTENGAIRYVVGVGDAHGVTSNTGFTVYDTSSCKNELGHVVVEKIEPSRSFVVRAPAFEIPATGAFVLWAPIRMIRIFLDPTSKLVILSLARLEKDTAVGTSTSNPSNPSFVLVNERGDSPDIIISSSSGDTLSFEIVDQACIDAQFTKTFDVPATDEERMKVVFRHIVHFYCCLNHKPTPMDENTAASADGNADGEAVPTDGNVAGDKEPRSDVTVHENKAVSGVGDDTGDIVKVEWFELSEPKPDVNSSSVVRELKSNNLIKDGKLNIEVTNPSDKAYGFRIKNKTTMSLFVSVFYFDMSDLSITAYYEPPSPGNVPSLTSEGVLTIGYGSSGSQAMGYTVPEGQSLDVGYVKLFMSTKYVNYHNMLRESPFRGRGTFFVNDTFDFWHTLNIPIILRKK